MQLKSTFLLIALTLLALQGFSQSVLSLSDPSLAPRVRFNESQFVALFNQPVNTTIQLTSSLDNFSLQGNVISNDYNADTQTRFVVIELSNFQTGTILKLKSTTESGVTTYKGTITNADSADAYQISSIFDGNVVFSKFKASQVTDLQP